ncbi:MAG: GNAT family N-acetyltransferase [Candidatus Baltobacteraceae bacterium]
MRLPDVIATHRLRGRRMTQGDLPYLIETDSDPAIQMPIFGRVHTPDESQARMQRWLDVDREHGLGFYLFNAPGAERIGHAGLFPSKMSPGDVEVGYALKPAFWGCGYATEMTLAFLHLAFETLRVERVIGVTRSKNTGSRHVMEKAGMLFDAPLDAGSAGPAVRYAIDRERFCLRNATHSA